MTNKAHLVLFTETAITLCKKVLTDPKPASIGNPTCPACARLYRKNYQPALVGNWKTGSSAAGPLS